jgi:hypothetical protein
MQGIDTCLTAGSALIAGSLAGWFTRRSVPRAIIGLSLTALLSAGFMLAPRAKAAIQLWRMDPQEVSLGPELFAAALVSILLAAFVTAVGWVLGFVYYLCTKKAPKKSGLPRV